MDHSKGARSDRGDRVDFDRRVRLEFRGAQITSDGGLLVMRELDDALGLSDLASAALRDNRRGKNTVHRLDGLFRQSVYGRLAGYEDVNDADRLALDPVMRQVVGGRAVDVQAALASQMGRFETKTLAMPENRNALAVLLMSSTLVETPLGRITVEPSDGNGLRAPSQVMVDKPMSVPVRKIGPVFGHLDDQTLLEVNRALALFLGIAS